MCGVAGFLDLKSETPEPMMTDQIVSMTDTMVHRGPDSSGIWSAPEQGVALGHRRLAIIDLSAAGHQPMVSACGRFVATYNGEIYNFPDLRNHLEKKGHRFRGHSDTEVLLASVAEWGVQRAVEKFIGMFAFGLWDRQESRLYLVRDRLGIKPLYYGRIGDLFLFGSELRSIVAHPRFSPEIDRNALALYFSRNYVPCPFSIYRGIFKLPPGTILNVSVAADYSESMQPYWSLHDVAAAGASNPFTGDTGQAANELESILSDAVKRRMIADVPLGVFLSGGIDSAVVTSLMQAQSNRPIKTYTIGYDEADFDEAGHAQAIARHLGTDHTSLTVTPAEAFAVLPELGQMFDEPFADASQIPTFLVSKLARESVKVVLTGDGGDEIFGGYTRHLWSERITRIAARLPKGSHSLVARSLTVLAPHQWDQILRFLPPGLRQSKPGSKLHRVASLLDAPDAAEVYRRVMSHWAEPENLVRESRLPDTILDRHGDWPALPDTTSTLMFLDGVTYLPDNCLAKVDRASMAVSLEARTPILDHRVVEFAWRLPLGLKISNGAGKQILREVLFRHVPRDMIERPKMGFGVPVRDWMRGPMRDWTESLINEGRLREEGILNADLVSHLWQQHLTGRRDWYNQIWSVVMFQAWRDATSR